MLFAVETKYICTEAFADTGRCVGTKTVVCSDKQSSFSSSNFQLWTGQTCCSRTASDSSGEWPYLEVEADLRFYLWLSLNCDGWLKMSLLMRGGLPNESINPNDSVFVPPIGCLTMIVSKLNTLCTTRVYSFTVTDWLCTKNTLTLRKQCRLARRLSGTFLKDIVNQYSQFIPQAGLGIA